MSVAAFYVSIFQYCAFRVHCHAKFFLLVEREPSFGLHLFFGHAEFWHIRPFRTANIFSLYCQEDKLMISLFCAFLTQPVVLILLIVCF